MDPLSPITPPMPSPISVASITRRRILIGLAVAALVIGAGAYFMLNRRGDVAVAPTYTPRPSRASSVPTDQYQIQCSWENDVGGTQAYGRQFSWFNTFSQQIIAGWTLGSFCYNSTTNQTVYFKYKTQADYSTLFQLGVYDIAKDTFDKGEAFYPEPRSLARCRVDDAIDDTLGTVATTWTTNGYITYVCSAGDGGYVESKLYSYDIASKKATLIRTCAASDPVGIQCNPPK